MKQHFNITKIGNSLFATLSNKVVKQLNLRPGDQILYEVVTGKRQLVMHIIPKGSINTITELVEDLDEADKTWISESAGSLLKTTR